MTSRSVWDRPGNINKFQWNRECFFLRHEEFNSRSIVMTIDEVTLDRPKVGTDFSVICLFLPVETLSRFALKFSTEIFTPHSRFLSQSGFSKFVVYSCQFCCTILQIGNMISSSFCLVNIGQHLFCICFFEDKYPTASNVSKSSKSAIKKCPFQIPPTISSYPRKIPGKHFLVSNWWIIAWSFGESKMIFDKCSKRNWLVLLKWFSKSSFIGRLPVGQEVLDVSQTAMAFHRVRPPPFIWSWP